MLWRMPSMTKLVERARLRLDGARAVAACVTSLAIIGSYQIEISPPSKTPVSLRTVTPS